jgi:hypothetical protein
MKLFNQNNEVIFNDASHTYTVKATGKNLISATTIISKFKPEFDPTGIILNICAKKKGISPTQLKQEWEQIKNDGTSKGRKFHKEIEDFINTGKFNPKSDNAGYIKQFKKFKFKGKLHSEEMIYSIDDGIAGTVDLIEVLKDSFINIYDFKTNKKLTKTGYRGQKLLPPLEHLENSDLDKYALQLSLYGYMAELYGYLVNNLVIFYINPETKQIDRYDLNFKRADVIKMIRCYNHNNILTDI